MQQEGSRLQDRLAFAAGAATLLAFSVRKRRPEAGGIALLALGGWLVTTGVGWLRPTGSRSPRHRGARAR